MSLSVDEDANTDVVPVCCLVRSGEDVLPYNTRRAKTSSIAIRRGGFPPPRAVAAFISFVFGRHIHTTACAATPLCNCEISPLKKNSASL